MDYECMFSPVGCMYTRDICPTSENILTKGAQTWMLQKENNTERRESFVLKRILM
jgi:hypothetical protein